MPTWMLGLSSGSCVLQRGMLRKALLSEGGEEIYWLVLRESCSYLVEVVTTLPKFSSSSANGVAAPGDGHSRNAQPGP